MKAPKKLLFSVLSWRDCERAGGTGGEVDQHRVFADSSLDVALRWCRQWIRSASTQRESSSAWTMPLWRVKPPPREFARSMAHRLLKTAPPRSPVTRRLEERPPRPLVSSLQSCQSYRSALLPFSPRGSARGSKPQVVNSSLMLLFTRVNPLTMVALAPAHDRSHLDGKAGKQKARDTKNPAVRWQFQ